MPGRHVFHHGTKGKSRHWQERYIGFEVRSQLLTVLLTFPKFFMMSWSMMGVSSVDIILNSSKLIRLMTTPRYLDCKGAEQYDMNLDSLWWWSADSACICWYSWWLHFATFSNMSEDRWWLSQSGSRPDSSWRSAGLGEYMQLNVEMLLRIRWFCGLSEWSGHMEWEYLEGMDWDQWKCEGRIGSQLLWGIHRL